MTPTKPFIKTLAYRVSLVCPPNEMQLNSVFHMGGMLLSLFFPCGIIRYLRLFTWSDPSSLTRQVNRVKDVPKTQSFDKKAFYKNPMRFLCSSMAALFNL
ncbi:MAG TPA: hypothetical protein VGA86_01085, partial [Desulfatiglandales bacterium]